MTARIQGHRIIIERGVAPLVHEISEGAWDAMADGALIAALCVHCGECVVGVHEWTLDDPCPARTQQEAP